MPKQEIKLFIEDLVIKDTIEETIEELVRIQELYQEKFNSLVIIKPHYGDSAEYEIKGVRLETDEEYNTRLGMEKSALMDREKREFEKYKELHEKFKGLV